MVSCTEHIAGENQSLATYIGVLAIRLASFANDMESASGPLILMDESDWDDQYRAWFEQDQSL